MKIIGISSCNIIYLFLSQEELLEIPRNIYRNLIK